MARSKSFVTHPSVTEDPPCVNCYLQLYCSQTNSQCKALGKYHKGQTFTKADIGKPRRL